MLTPNSEISSKVKAIHLYTRTVTQPETHSIIFIRHNQDSIGISTQIITITTNWQKEEMFCLQSLVWMDLTIITVWLRTFISKYLKINKTRRRADTLNLYLAIKIQELLRGSLRMMLLTQIHQECAIWTTLHQIPLDLIKPFCNSQPLKE